MFGEKGQKIAVTFTFCTSARPEDEATGSVHPDLHVTAVRGGHGCETHHRLELLARRGAVASDLCLWKRLRIAIDVGQCVLH
jgi:hypothetical protein